MWYGSQDVFLERNKKVIIRPKSKSKEEEKIEKIGFNIFKFSKREKPTSPKDILFICCFSEFGCETVGLMYCVPRIIKEYPNKYVIVVGWYGREYLYRHLADEFWELKEEHQWLREYARAFHNTSKNLYFVEKQLQAKGIVAKSGLLGHYVIGDRCRKCKSFFEAKSECPSCGSSDIEPSMFRNLVETKRGVVRVPRPSDSVMAKALGYLKPNAVGIFARGRKCYGRNLEPSYYIELIKMLERNGYSPIWLGEKATVQPCPVNHIVDFSRMEESRNLELTLAIICNLKFTIQYWTASTRLASMMGVPYLLFESPDQIYGVGQEGYRRNLCDFAPNKLVVAHFNAMLENPSLCLKLTERAIKEMELFDFNEIHDTSAAQTDAATKSLRGAYMQRVLQC